jgi:hypothetical protein
MDLSDLTPIDVWGAIDAAIYRRLIVAILRMRACCTQAPCDKLAHWRETWQIQEYIVCGGAQT